MRMDLDANTFKLLEERKLFATAVFFSSCGHFLSLNKLVFSVLKEVFKMVV